MNKLRAMTVEQLSKIISHPNVDKHLVTVWVDQSEIMEQIEKSLFPKNEVLESRPFNIKKEDRIVKIHYTKIKAVFQCGISSITRGQCPGITHASVNRNGMCEVNLDHPEILRFGLTRSSLNRGKKLFYKSKEVIKKMGKNANNYGAIENFGHEYIYKVGRDKRVFKEAVDNFLRDEESQLEVPKIPDGVLAFPKESYE